MATVRATNSVGGRYNDPPDELNDEAAVKAVTALYQAGLAGLKQVAESQN